jgi:8-oxo-dGTP pyrophosphatase MutT (NUDIX family)
MDEVGEVIEKVLVWVHSGPRILLLKTTSERGGLWQPVTGKVEKGEDLAEAALREAVEETGLDFAARPEPLGHVHEFKGRFGPARETAFSLEAPRGASPPDVTIDPKEHVEWKWAAIEEALSALPYENQRVPLARLAARLGTKR